LEGDASTALRRIAFCPGQPRPGKIALNGVDMCDSGGGSGLSNASNARLAILPALTHYNVFSSPALAAAVIPFLDAPLPSVN
jgi:hypothetical protein